MFEMVVDHRLIAVGHLPASGGTLADHFDNCAPVQTRFLGKMQCLGQRLHQSRYRDLVAHLGFLARTGVTDPAAHLGIDFHHGEGLVVSRLFPATHDRQGAIFRARLPA